MLDLSQLWMLLYFDDWFLYFNQGWSCLGITKLEFQKCLWRNKCLWIVFFQIAPENTLVSFQIANEYNVMGFETDVRIRYYVHVISYNWLKSRSVQDILHTCMGSFCKINEICVPFYPVYIFLILFIVWQFGRSAIYSPWFHIFKNYKYRKSLSKFKRWRCIEFQHVAN